MNFSRCCLAALFVALSLAAARAVEFDWPGHGSIAFDVPANWSLRGAPAGVGFNFRGDVDAKSAAVLQITVVALPPDKSAPTKDAAKAHLEAMVADALPSSVEKEFSPRALRLRQGYGWYVQLTDSSLVGKPPEPENLKIMRNGFASLDEHTMVVITMQFDDPDSAAPTEMLRIVESMRLQGARPDALSIRRTDEFYELSVPPSRLTLKIPAKGFTTQNERVGGSTANPRYFYFKDADSGIIISGWFEAASKYSGLLSFWNSEAEGLKRGGQPDPTHVRFGKAGDWEVVEYDLPVPRVTSSHLRAELAQGRTWIDLHASLTADRLANELHSELRAFIESLVVDGK